MSFDNRVMDVNGVGDENLKKMINLAFSLYSGNTLAKNYIVTKEHGLILLSYTSKEEAQNFLIPLDADAAFEFVKDWLKSNSASKVTLESWFKSAHDYDVMEDDDGWRVYIKDWGRVDGHHGAICAVTPSFIWYGK